MAAAVLGAIALLAAACGDGGDVRIVALTPTPVPEQTVVRGADGPATIVTATPTPGALEGTATPTPTVTATSDEPPGPPDKPDEPLAGALLLRDYLASGELDLLGCLPELVAVWELAPTSGERCLYADFDGDGASEFVFALTLPDGGGDVWFYESREEEYRLISSARVLANDTLEGVTIESVEDLTGDRFPDLVISTLNCDGAACTRQLLIMSAHGGRLADLMPPGVEVNPTAELRIEVPGEGSGGTSEDRRLPQLIIKEDVVADSTVGPVRPSSLALSWGGAGFVTKETARTTRYLFHAIVDADEAFRRGDYERARTLYEAAASATSLVDWRVERGRGSGRAELTAYALFRAGLSAQRLRDEEGMFDLLDQATTPPLGRTLHGQIAFIYRAGVEDDEAPGVICSEIELFLRAQGSTFNSIWNYGPHNPTHRIGELCS